MFDVEQVFSYHAPTPEQLVAIDRLRLQAKNFAREILTCCPVGPDRSVALRRLRETLMTANAAVVVPTDSTI